MWKLTKFQASFLYNLTKTYKKNTKISDFYFEKKTDVVKYNKYRY